MYVYSSKNINAPKLNNEWGDFNKVINYILDGGIDCNITKIEYVEPKKVKITMDASNFELHETIEVHGATVSEYNKRYFVESVDIVTNTAILTNRNITTVLSEDSSTNIKAKVIPCGMTKKFGGVSEQRTVFKSANGMEYRIDDRDFTTLLTPPLASFNASWQKVCRVSMSKNYESLDSHSGRIEPFNVSRPNENYKPDGNYIGGKYFIYNQGTTTTSTINDYITTVNANLPRSAMDYIIYANSQVMYIYIINKTNSNNKHHYILGEYNTNKGIISAAIASHIGEYEYNTTASNSVLNNINLINTNGDSYQTSASILCNSTASKNLNNYITIFDNSLGSSPVVNCKPSSTINTQNSAVNCSSGKFSSPFIDGIKYFSDVLVAQITGSGQSPAQSYIYDVFGTFIDMKWINCTIRNDDFSTIKLEDGELYKYIRTDRYSSYDLYCGSEYLIRLDVQ